MDEPAQQTAEDEALAIKQNPFRRNLLWIEVYGHIWYLVLGLLVAATAIPSLYGRAIGLWHALHVAVPAGYIATAMWSGEVPLSRMNRCSPRFVYHAVYVVIGAGALLALGIGFQIVQLVHVFSPSCAVPGGACSDLVIYVVVLALSAVLSLLCVLLIISVSYMWLSKSSNTIAVGNGRSLRSQPIRA
jgi:hypothetical protein